MSGLNPSGIRGRASQRVVVSERIVARYALSQSAVSKSVGSVRHVFFHFFLAESK
jgi:hypothetical protein